MKKKGLLGAVAIGVLIGGLMIAPELLTTDEPKEIRPKNTVERIDKAFTEKKEQEVLRAAEVFGASYLTHDVDIASNKEWTLNEEEVFKPTPPHLHYSVKPTEPSTKIHVYNEAGRLIGYEYFNEYRETSDHMFVTVVQLRPGQYMTATKPVKILPMIPREEYIEEILEQDKKALFDSMKKHKDELIQKIEEGKNSSATDEYIEFYQNELDELEDTFKRLRSMSTPNE